MPGDFAECLEDLWLCDAAPDELFFHHLMMEGYKIFFHLFRPKGFSFFKQEF